jgi:hypothetical protein
MNKFYLAHNGIDVFHYGSLQENQIVTTGQPFLEYFELEQELIDRLLELGQEFISTSPIINQSAL